MLNPYPKLNFPPINLRAQRQKESNTLMVWSSPRSCYLVLTPEEWVRRHLVEFLVGHYSIAYSQIIEEYPVQLNGQSQRADVVVTRGEKAMILVECKAFDVKITPDTLSQAVRYNSVVGAKFIILTNGFVHLCFERSNEGRYLPLNSFPEVF